METNPLFHIEEFENVNISLLNKPVEPSDYLRLYNNVGRIWNWADRVLMNEDDLRKIINAENNSIYVFYINRSEAGYVEFISFDNFVEIQYFGLYPEFTGKGYGKKLFEWCINKAWSFKPKWIQLNTCDLDHNAALNLYKNIGFTEYKTETAERYIFE